MKKVLKYTGISLGSIAILAIFASLVLEYFYGNWFRFYYAAKLDDTAKMQEIINNGFNINQRVFHFTPLHGAIIENSQFETIEFMIKHGADLSIKTGKGVLPIHIAIYQDRADLVEFFLSKKLNFDLNYKSYSLMGLAKKLKSKKVIFYLESCYNNRETIPG